MKKKALFLKAFFFVFATTAAAQSIFFQEPGLGDTLEPIEDVRIGFDGPKPIRIELYVNGELTAARREAPFSFRIGWDPQESQKLLAVAFFGDGQKATCERNFRGIKADMEESVEALQCFPFWEMGASSGSEGPNLRIQSPQGPITPKSSGPASVFALHIVVLVDVSGSMMPFAADLQYGIANLVTWSQEMAPYSDWIVFDQQPLAVSPVLLGQREKFRNEFKGTARSTIWDSIAAACQLFSQTPRRIIVLISDGHDDGSVHDSGSTTQFLKAAQASLIWINPTTLHNQALKKMTRRSGGFLLSAFPDERWWDVLERRVERQHYVMIANPPAEVSIKASSGKLWYPQWKINPPDPTHAP